jgi:hypothetical protein
MEGIDDLLAECRGLLKQTTNTKPRYIPGIPQIPGRVGYITQIRSSHWPTIDITDPSHQNDQTSAGHNSCPTNPDIEALLAKYASVPNVPSARLTNTTDIAFEAAFLDGSRTGKFISSFPSQHRSEKNHSRSTSPETRTSLPKSRKSDSFAKAFSSTVSNNLKLDNTDSIPQRIMLPESLRVRLTGVSSRSTHCFLTAFRAVKIKSEQSTSNIHDQKSLPKQKFASAFLPSLAYGRRIGPSDRDLPDRSSKQESEFLQNMQQKCALLQEATVSTGDRKSILKSNSRTGILKQPSKSPPRDRANLGLDQSFVSNSEGLCHSLMLHSKLGNQDPNNRSKSGSKSRSNSARKAPWRPNSIVAPIPTAPQLVAYTPPAVVLKPEHPLYESVSKLQHKTAATAGKPSTQKKRGLIRDSQTPAAPQTQQPDKQQASTTQRTRNVRSRLYDSRTSHRSLNQNKESVFEVSMLSGQDEGKPRPGMKSSKSSRVVTFGNSINSGSAMKPKQVCSDNKIKSTSIHIQIAEGPATNDSVHHHSTSKDVSRRSNIQRSNFLPASGASANTVLKRKLSDSSTRIHKDSHNVTFKPLSSGLSLANASHVESYTQLDHEHLPGQAGCSICIYNFGKNMPYETKHLGKLYAARRDEYQKQVLSNPDIAILSADRSRSNSKSVDRKSRSNSKNLSSAKGRPSTQTSTTVTRDQDDLRCEGTGSSSLERARRLKKEMNHAVQQHKEDRQKDEEQACLERLGFGGKISVQQILQRYSSGSMPSAMDYETENEEAPRASIGLQRAEQAHRGSSSGQTRPRNPRTEQEESGVLIKPNGDRYEFHLKKLN